MSDKNMSELAPRGFFGEFDPFRDFFDAAFRLPRASGLGQGPVASRWAPPLDLLETKDGYAITVELPGMGKDDVTVELHEGQLVVRGEKVDEKVEEDEHRHYSERSYGRFSRSIRLPENAGDDVKATFTGGVLKVEVPKKESTKPRVVTIEAS